MPLQCFGPHAKQHGVRGLSENYYTKLHSKLGHGTWKIHQITCDCDEYKSM